MIVSQITTGKQLLSEHFPPALTPEAAAGLRDSLDARKNTSLIAFYACSVMDRDAMVGMIQRAIAEDGEEEAFQIVAATAEVRDNLDKIAALARMVEARVLIAAHVAMGVEWEDCSPSGKWDDAWTRYEAALAVERAYDAQHINIPDDLPIGSERDAACDAIPNAIWEESGRLGDIRGDVEDELFAMPSPNLAAFAQKVIICRAEGRDLNGLDDHLVEDARRLLAQDATS